jgi:hypothetical protein
VHGCVERTIGLEIILNAPYRNSEVTWVIWNLILVHLEAVLVSVQDRCTVCAKHTIDLEIISDAADGTPR